MTRGYNDNLRFQTTMSVGPTLAQRRDDSADVGPTYVAVWGVISDDKVVTTKLASWQLSGLNDPKFISSK